MIISTAASRTATHWDNQDISWEDFLKLVSSTKRTHETVEEYRQMPKEQQDRIKDVGGFLAGELRDGKRRSGHVEHRSMLTLDMDYARVNAWSIITSRCDYACCIYSTHKHSPEKPRLRLVIPLSRGVTEEEYPAVARKVAEDIGIEQFDDTTYEPARLMYWPSTSADGEFVFEQQDGSWLDPDTILARYPDWKDASSWPVSSRQSTRISRSVTKQADPTGKTGIVGEFCRAYPIQDAIENFMAEVYMPSHMTGRYDYVPAHSTAGVIIYEDKFAFSHNATDPACGRLCNAFDLVRIHKFAELDDQAREGTPLVKMPSFVAMRKLAEQDERVMATVEEERLAALKEDFGGKPGNPRQMFFIGKRFIPMLLGQWFMMWNICITIHGKLYIYKAGRYIEGKQIFKAQATEVLKTEFLTGRVNEALNYVKNTVPVVSMDEAVNTGEYLNVRNGRLNLDTMVLEPHNPEFRTIIQLPVEYDPQAQCSAINEFLNMVAGDCVPVIEEMLGYCLIPSMKYEATFLFTGDGHNGKGTLIALIQALFGEDNVSNVALQVLSENRFSAAQLYGKMVNLYADIPGRIVDDSSLFKMLTSGDRVMAENKYEAQFSFHNRAKLIFSANEMAGSKDNSFGYHRKWMVIPFKTKFQDRKLRERLFSQPELTGLLTKAVQGLQRLRAQDGFTQVDSAVQQKEQFRKKSDNVYQFVDECCEEAAGSVVGKQELYETYRRKCSDWGCFPVSQANFNNKLLGLMPQVKEDRNHKIRCWKGLKICANIEEFALANPSYLELVKAPLDDRPRQVQDESKTGIKTG